MTESSVVNPRSLEARRAEFASGRFLAMPIAGANVWSLSGLVLTTRPRHAPVASP